MIKKIVKGLWVFFALMVLAGIAVFASIAYGWIGYMPPVEVLENPNYKFATEILSEDGKVLGTWSLSKENRVYTSYNELSPAFFCISNPRFTTARISALASIPECSVKRTSSVAINALTMLGESSL